MNRLVIGLGTGRCGTQSLAYLLNRQKDAEVTHERVWQNIKWAGSEQQVLEMLQWAASLPRTGITGDVAFYYLPYTEFILSHAPDARFICLQRSRDETVDSFMRITPGINHWFDHGGKGWEPDMWDDSFPSNPEADKEKGLRHYWTEYYAEAERLARVHPDQFRIFSTSALGHIDGQKAILSFAGIKPGDQKLIVGIRKNTHGDRIRHDQKLEARERRQALLERIKRWLK